MARYCIVGAHPKGETNHLNSEFDLWKLSETSGNYSREGWKSIFFVVDLIKAGHEVLTAKENPQTISLGEPVEVELRIAHNKKNYKISEMPGK